MVLAVLAGHSVFLLLQVFLLQEFKTNRVHHFIDGHSCIVLVIGLYVAFALVCFGCLSVQINAEAHALKILKHRQRVAVVGGRDQRLVLVAALQYLLQIVGGGVNLGFGRTQHRFEARVISLSLLVRKEAHRVDYALDVAVQTL